MRILTPLLMLACGTFTFAQPIIPQWTKENVSGLHLSVVDKDRDKTNIEGLIFRYSGEVEVVLNLEKGPEAAHLGWKIVDNKLQIIYEGVFEELILVSRDSSTVVVKTDSGKIINYAIVKFDENSKK